MPPAISDDEKSDFGESAADISSKSRPERQVSAYKEARSDFDDDVNGDGTGKYDDALADAQNGENDDGADDEDGEDELGDDEYVVEKILGHVYDVDGTLKFHVKWEGYDREEDMTWEPEENLRENAGSVLDTYLESVGGRGKLFEETSRGMKRKRGKPAASTNKRVRRNGGHPQDSTPPASTEESQFRPPAGSWEDHVQTIDACEDESSGKIIVYLSWKSGDKSRHDTATVYKRCPQKMLRYYEEHIRIVKHTEG